LLMLLLLTILLGGGIGGGQREGGGKKRGGSRGRGSGGSGRGSSRSRRGLDSRRSRFVCVDGRMRTPRKTAKEVLIILKIVIEAQIRSTSPPAAVPLLERNLRLRLLSPGVGFRFSKTEGAAGCGPWQAQF